MRWLGALAVLGLLVGCGEDAASPASSGGAAGQAGAGGVGGAGTAGVGGAANGPLHAIDAEPQRSGDPSVGYHALVNENYVSCGIPWTAYAQVFGNTPDALKLPGRDGKNADMPYDQTVILTPSGVEAVAPNCLTCHAGRIDGKLVVGLGANDRDFTVGQTSSASLAKFLLSDPKDLAELDRFIERAKVIEPYTVTRTVGVNPADNLAAILFAHRDPQTFAWNDPPLLEPPPQIVVPTDVPAWWHMKKKNALYYLAAGRGDHARTLMAASTLCTDDVAEAKQIDSYMPDIYAYIRSIEPPVYPHTIDSSRVEQGRNVFETICARCHGTYGSTGEYPNVWVELDYVGTDPTLASGASQFAGRFLDWFSESFYGEVSRLEPQLGYVAPPLDGIWATAPYFHNGSVPTVEAVLNSSARPQFWRRTGDYDSQGLGLGFTSVDHGQDAEPDASQRKLIYDTTVLGYANTGHTFGDELSADERAAVIEYLKTL